MNYFGLYTLNERGEPVLCKDIEEWAHWFEKADRVVAYDIFNEEVIISTVFLGSNHRFGPGTPVLWETMVFNGKHDTEQMRCAGSREQAEMMHAKMYERVTGMKWTPTAKSK